MHRLLNLLVVLLVSLIFVVPARCETAQIKAQGTSDAVFGARDKAFQDAKFRALERYISGLKSQSEAGRLISIKKQLFDEIDTYVKEPTELAYEEKSGKAIITIQAHIDVTAVNNVVEKTFRTERKKAGIKKKQIAFVFVAREVQTVTTVRDHNISESIDNSVSSVDESQDVSESGSSKQNAASKHVRNKDEGLSIDDEEEVAKEEKNKLAQKASSGLKGNSSNRGTSSASASLRGNSRTKSSMSGDADTEEELSASASEIGNEEDTQAAGKYGRVYSAKVAVAEENQEDQDLKVDTASAFDDKEEFSAEASTKLARSEATSDDKRSKHKRNTNVKTKRAEDSASSEESDYATTASEKSKMVVKSDDSKYAEAKNTSIQHAEEQTYRVIENGSVSAQLSEIFTDNGMGVTDSFDAGELLLKLQKAKSVNQIRPGDMKQAIAAAQSEGADYLCIGTLDVDREMIDKATGNVQRYVLVNAGVYDLTKPKLQKAAAVGNLNFSGLGENPNVAKNNALNNAAKEAATKLVAQLRKHMLEEDED